MHCQSVCVHTSAVTSMGYDVSKPPRFKCCAEFLFQTVSHGTMLYAQGPQFWRFLSRHLFPYHHQIPSDLKSECFPCVVTIGPTEGAV